MLEAMIKKKGEAPPGAPAHLNSWRVEHRLNRGLELALQGCCVPTPSLFFTRKAMRGRAGQPVARKAVAWAWRWVWGALLSTGRTVVYSKHFSRVVCLKLCIPLEICSWSWRSLWAQIAVTTGNKIVPGMVTRALDGESGCLGLIFVPPMTHFVALWLSLDSSQTAWVPVSALMLTSG